MTTRWLIYKMMDGYEVVCSLSKSLEWRPINATPAAMRKHHGSPVCVVREKPCPVAFEAWDKRAAH